MATARAISKLQSRLGALSAFDDDYWAFKDDSERDLAHSLFQYPAMMVPRLQRQLLDEMLEADPTTQSVYDPFVGSGTVLTEAMLRGLDVAGIDVNPLAVLVSRTKAGPYHHELFAREARAVVAVALHDRRRRVEADFPGLTKWFNARAVVELSRLRRAIAGRPNPATRRFLWVALAETVRLTSNSRTSTVKLHIRDAQDLERRLELSPISVFAATARENARCLKDQAQLLTERRLLDARHYKRDVVVRVGDCRVPPPALAGPFDMIVTSPPYGDNATTLTYGQHSYLPLQWIDLEDIEDDLERDCLGSTHEIDFQSLGGSRRRALERAAVLRDRSPTLDKVMATLSRDKATGSRVGAYGVTRVGSFFADLDESLTPTLRRLKRNGLMLWVVGNRHVNGRPVPTTQILTELLGERVEHVACIERRIISKRHAVRNNIASTMTSESLLVYRKLRTEV